MIKTICVKLCP